MSYSIHRILAAIADPAERFAAIAGPPPDPRTGRRRWTPDQAKQRVGYQVARPTTVQEKVEAIHDLAADEAVRRRPHAERPRTCPASC